jgi:hypothetical protein
MRKAIVIATIVLFIVWSAMDAVLHGILLAPIYEATAALWRPVAEMKQGVLFGTTFIAALFFVLLYGEGFARRGMGATLRFGVYFGIAVGVGMGFGTYAAQPIPLALATSWLVGTIVETVVGALLAHWVFGRFGGGA